jgi:hypothetical protein
MEHTITTPNFKLFFGKFKGQLLSNTPYSYQVWLVQTNFFKKLNIKYPHKIRVGNFEGSWYEIDVLTIKIPTKKVNYSTNEIEPEEKFYKGYATYLERNNYD